MANTEVKDELKKYISEVKLLNGQLQELEERKGQILKVGTRIEGVIAYLRGKLSEEELAEIDNPNPAAEPAAASAA